MALENVSDTARWVAVYRVMESARPDALFHDPYAERLAGERGHQILDSLKGGRTFAWPMIVRTAVFDEIILDAVQKRGADLVLNLAAGLDARPWRLPLPPELHWVDVDLPGILNYKTEMLRDETPKCRYEAVTLDLRDAEARRAVRAARRRIEAGDRRYRRIADLSRSRAGGGARHRSARATGLPGVADRSRQPSADQKDEPDLGKEPGRGRSAVQVRARRKHGFLPALRLARGPVSRGLGGGAAPEPHDEGRLDLEPARKADAGEQKGGIPAVFGVCVVGAGV
ncbi:MAG TPA: class I SAM-dependent methyltransferase, partial [Thermoanaerobaculia bacterium]